MLVDALVRKHTNMHAKTIRDNHEPLKYKPMKNYSILLFLLLFATGTYAAPVDKETALQSAQAFFMKHAARNAAGLSLAYENLRHRSAKSSDTSEKSASYYIFNRGENGGYVVVSGDDRTATILGYSEEGHFDADNVPVNMAEWLKGYEEQMEYLDAAGIQVSKERKVNSVNRATPTMRAVIPMLKSRWTQDEPFCNLLPVISNYHLPVGCAATAMAQVMYYYKWPEATVAEIPGYTNATQYSNYDEIVLDTIPANTPIDWANMLNVYSGSETEAQNNAVAELSKYCGIALKMDYARGGSAASLSDVPRALVNYFGYNYSMQHVMRDTYDDDTWEQLIYTELSQGRPVLYGGQSTGGGHGFVVDGYDGEAFFHINWGWNNGADGYFLLSVLNPNDTSGTGASSTSDGYSSNQEAVIGIKPSYGSNPGVIPDDDVVDVPLHLSFTIDSITADTIHGVYQNNTSEQHAFILGLGYYDENGVLQTCSKFNVNNLPPGYYWYYDLKVNITTPGRYAIFPISKVYGTEEWVPAPHDVRYVECIVHEDGTKTLIMHPIKSLEATMTFREPKIAGVMQRFDATIRNLGEEYSGYVYFKATNEEADYSGTAYKRVQLKEGETTQALFGFLPPSPGKYDVILSTSNEFEDVIGSSSVVITEGKYTTNEVLRTKVTVENSKGNKIYGNKIKGVYTLINPTDSAWSGSVRLFIYSNSTGSGTYYAVLYLDYYEVVLPGEDVEIPFEYVGEYGDYYIIGMKYMNTYHEVGASNSYQLTRGFVGYLADGTMKGAPGTGDVTIGEEFVAADFSGLSEDAITSITSNSNPNMLLYFSEGTTLKSKLTKSVNNIVEGSHSDKITLTDKYDFYIPTTFTADAISYSRKPSLVADGDEWESIALPFEVSKISVGSNEVDFYHSMLDKNKDFWVREFSEYEGKDMYYGMTEKMEAYVPYLIGFPSSFQNKEIKFEGTNATLVADNKIVSSSQYYTLIGTMKSMDMENIYTLADDGKSFTLKANATVEPFRAYVKAKYDEGLPQKLPITLIDSSKLLGDVNGDNVISVADVSMLVSYLLGSTVEGIKLTNADVDGDGTYSISDVTKLVDLILKN